ncbi:hypothetical protein SteCoe_10955 [Stentor coeruleus]|uniref:DUF1015 domain-containing protein n=1 Tax=Stentor coeruleus TaxID=5963 RepID=A0A1R2CEB7_9CILI|nr:hypothetical protein SteCoe_10955 [Stentor coeruleus]
MVKISAFRGYVVDQSLAQRLIAPPYDVLDSAEARVMAEGNEYSFLHCNKPEIDLAVDVDVYSDIVYETGRKNLMSFIEKNWLVHESQPIVYIYAITMNGRTQYGVVAAASVDDYENKLIKKHELTRKKKEEDRTKLTDIQGANVGPVFLTYRNCDRIDAITQVVTSKGAFVDVVTDDQVRHTFWKCSVEETHEIVDAFANIPCTYIADGHHRAASAYNVCKLRRQRALDKGVVVDPNDDCNFFLAIHFPDNQLKIMDYNRVLKDLNGNSPDEFLGKLAENFEIFDIESPNPKQKHEFSLFLNGKWTGMRLKAEKLTGTDPVSQLDSYLLTKWCLAPILGIEDLTTSERIDFVGGIRGLGELEKRCREDCVAAIALHPVQVEEVMSIADHEQIMPPKSTWFEPKPRSGMVVKVFN